MSAARSQTAGTGWVVRFALQSWRGWIVIASVTLLTSLTALLNPWPLKLLIDHALTNNPMPGWAARVRDLLPHAATPLGFAGYVAVAGVILFAIDAACDVILQRQWIITGQRLVCDLAERLFAHVQRLSIVRHSRMQVGDLISRISGDSWCVYNLANAVLFTPAHGVIMTAAMLAVLWRMNHQLMLVSAAAAPLMALVAYFAGSATRRLHRQ